MSTIFSNGSSNRIENEIILLYTENSEKESQVICISSLGEIIVDNHVYTAKDSWKMIKEVKEIIEHNSIASLKIFPTVSTIGKIKIIFFQM